MNLGSIVSPVVKLASSGVDTIAPLVSVAGRAVSAVADGIGHSNGVGGDQSGSVGAAMSQAAHSAQLDSLIQRQLTTSLELQRFSTESNIEKSKHESRMAIIANIRSR